MQPPAPFARGFLRAIFGGARVFHFTTGRASKSARKMIGALCSGTPDMAGRFRLETGCRRNRQSVGISETASAAVGIGRKLTEHPQRHCKRGSEPCEQGVLSPKRHDRRCQARRDGWMSPSPRIPWSQPISRCQRQRVCSIRRFRFMPERGGTARMRTVSQEHTGVRLN